MKPLLARRRLEQVAAHLARGEALPPLLSGWIGLAILKRLQDADSNLDQLLGLRSRQGGRLGACSQQPARDQALRELAGEAGTVKDRATALHMRVIAHRSGADDPELAEIARRYGDPPLSLRQLQRVIGGRTEAARLIADDGNLASDMSSRPMTAPWQHQPDRSIAS